MVLAHPLSNSGSRQSPRNLFMAASVADPKILVKVVLAEFLRLTRGLKKGRVSALN
jgi:hypothetical protein